MTEFEQNPTWKPNQTLLLNNPVRVTVKGTPVAQGSGKFGNWYLFMFKVTNQVVSKGRGTEETQVPNYTGEVAFFANDKNVKHIQTLCVANIEGETDILVTKKSKTARIQGVEKKFNYLLFTDLNGDEPKL